MCNRYAPPRSDDVSQRWRPRQVPVNYPPGPIFPRAPGPFIRAARDSVEPVRELAVGQWALIPWFAKAAKLPYSTNKAVTRRRRAGAMSRGELYAYFKRIGRLSVFWSLYPST